MFKRKAQGAFEHILLLAGILLVVAILVLRDFISGPVNQTLQAGLPGWEKPSELKARMTIPLYIAERLKESKAKQMWFVNIVSTEAQVGFRGKLMMQRSSSPVKHCKN